MKTSGKYYRTTINLKDKNSWFKFKAICNLKQKKVGEQIEELLREFINKNEKGGKING